MARTRRHRKAPSRSKPIRASVSLSAEVYRTLEDLAKQKKVSVAWLIRDAAEKYIAEQWPLFAKTQ
jgi:metal-responsive CopG/Arc/MetJ family transcriptional regulator